ncbi:nuclear transport factor 2 family protein [Aldersonia sp. NBC_00410]|uniref:nuclear transport factor 2 family protein n=1 Tax=Aldersonia sp. NBC_00410 TaxID=2975954 RepID=UPI0022582AF4|nr:nuclear transport factor 2 family protein [Aldersonia sp. NBC_00410]MCX5042348.1 nuclear transport factor 2 family protein [Aldersonia sp. NBC_00410]
MSDLREDQAQIAEVLIRYATGIDQRDWDLFRTCWTADAVADYGAIGQFSGIDALTDFMFASHDAMGDTHHRLSNFVIDVGVGGDADKATARSYVHAILIATPGDSGSWIDAVGHYDDVLIRTSDGWRISHRTVHMSRVMTAAGTH